MKKNKNKQLNEAIALMNSEVQDVFITDLESSIEKAIDKAKGEAKAHIESAVALSNEEKERITQSIEKILQRKINAIFTVKSSVLGGFKIRVGDWRLDATLSQQLDRMESLIA